MYYLGDLRGGYVKCIASYHFGGIRAFLGPGTRVVPRPRCRTPDGAEADSQTQWCHLIWSGPAEPSNGAWRRATASCLRSEGRPAPSLRIETFRIHKILFERSKTGGTSARPLPPPGTEEEFEGGAYNTVARRPGGFTPEDYRCPQSSSFKVYYFIQVHCPKLNGASRGGGAHNVMPRTRTFQCRQGDCHWSRAVGRPRSPRRRGLAAGLAAAQCAGAHGMCAGGCR